MRGKEDIHSNLNSGLGMGRAEISVLVLLGSSEGGGFHFHKPAVCSCLHLTSAWDEILLLGRGSISRLFTVQDDTHTTHIINIHILRVQVLRTKLRFFFF